MSIGITLRTWLYGECVGIDAFGNRYYRRRDYRRRDYRRRGGRGRRRWPSPKNGRETRWVVYHGEAEASRIPSEWHAWMHHTSDDVPSSRPVLKPSWGLDHQPNPTGTAQAWHRRGSALFLDGGGSRRDPSRGDYRPWTPDGNGKPS